MPGRVTIDYASLARSFPDTKAVPPLLLEFAEWLAQVPHGGVGYFDAIAGEPLAQIFSDPPPPVLAQKLAPFLRLPDA